MCLGMFVDLGYIPDMSFLKIIFRLSMASGEYTIRLGLHQKYYYWNLFFVYNFYV